MKTTKRIAILALMSVSLVSSARISADEGPPSLESFEEAQSYPGNPGAQIRSVRYSDGMNIKVAIYPGPRGSNATPQGIVAGYGMDISYLHYLARQLQAQGYPVFIVQPPGNGSGAVRSKRPDNSDGFHNTIEGFGSMYMDGLGQAMRRFFGQKVILMGHSRAGYQIRFFQSGLRYQGLDASGKPVLKFKPEALAEAAENFAGLVSLYSPLKPDPRLVALAQKFPEAIPKLRQLETLMLEAKAMHVERSANLAGAAAFLSPLNLLWGPLAPFAAAVNGQIAREVGGRVAKAHVELTEEIVKKRVIDLLTNRRDLDKLDRIAISLMRRRYPEYFEAGEDPEADIEAARWMTGNGVDDAALRHVMDFSSREGPTPAQVEEMAGLVNKEGLSAWKTIGVDESGKPYSLIKQLVKGRKNTKIPYLIMEASGDGSWEAAQAEAKLLGAEAGLVQGGHGGAVLGARAARDLQCKLEAVFEMLQE